MAVNRPAWAAGVSWVLALVALLLGLAIIFLPAVVPANHVSAGVCVVLLALAVLLP